MRKTYKANLLEIRPGTIECSRGRFAAASFIVIMLAVVVALVACVQQGNNSERSNSAIHLPAVEQLGYTSRAEEPSDDESTQFKSSSDCVAQQQEASLFISPDSDTADVSREAYEPGVVLISLKEGLEAQKELDTIRQETGLKGLSIASQGKWYVELALPEGVSVEQATRTLSQSSVVESAQPNFYYYLMDAVSKATFVSPATTASASQLQAGALRNLLTQGIEIDDPYAAKLWGLSSVRAYDAWKIARCEGSVTVAVIDNVFNVNHEDLKGNVAVAYNAITQQEDDDIAGSSYGGNDKQHGTHVAGIIAAEANNGKGVAGVSYNANLMLLRTAHDNATFDTKTLLNAYAYAIDNKDKYNVRVLNMSLGGYMPNDTWEGKDDQLLRAVDRAWDAGIITVTSAGNAGYYEVDDANIKIDAPFSCYPGDYRRCVNVMNLQKKKDDDSFDVERNSDSNYNEGNRKNKDIAAPGTDIYSTTCTSATSYNNSTGTSMAAPSVSGVLALMFACRPDLTPAQAVRTLYATATDLGDKGFDAEYGYGEVNALAALQACSDENYDPGAPDDSGDYDEPSDDSPDDPSGSDGDDVAPDVKPAKKLRNTLTVTAKYPKVRASALKSKDKTIARKTALTVKKACGTITYRKLSGSLRLKIAKETGKITIKKGTKRGMYRMQVRVRAAGDDEYKPRVITVTVRIRVR